MNDLKFVDILSVDDELKDKVRRWRNKKKIRKFMLTQHLIGREEHLRWLESLRQKDEQKFWIVFADEIPIGSVYLQNINYTQLNSEWGFYIGEDAYIGKGLGKRIVCKLLKHFFEVMNFDVLSTKVFSDNIVALKLYRKFKFVEAGRLPGDSGKEIVVLSFSRADWIKWKRDFENVCL